MTAPITSADSASVAGIEPELTALEHGVSSLITHVKTLRGANESLRRDLAAAESRNHALSGRVAEAKRRLDLLLARMPEPAE